MVFLISAIITFLIFKYIILPFAKNIASEDNNKDDDSFYVDDDDFPDLFN